ncbi:MAG TPA: type III pantothenate kinase [Bdellovibrionales bacterium]|nr:type III pantothenate kinase [Bdellovibrionales bacterium]
MILSLDVGNTTIHGGVFEEAADGNHQLKMQFRRTSEFRASSDELGIFLRSVLRENGIDQTGIRQIAICSVVPDAIHSLRNACVKYFGINPFLLQAGVKTGLKIKYRNPVEVGADRIANSIAGVNLYPGRNLIIVDFGTATTFCTVSKDLDYLGGVIIAGLRISMEALETKTAKLPSVEIVSMREALGRSTVESIQSGLYYGQVGTVREIVGRLTKECFRDEKPVVIATGGFAGLFEKEGLFDTIHPDLVLKGLNIALRMNS